MQQVSHELNFQRLLHRSKKLSRDALSQNKFRLKSSIATLEMLYIQLQDSKIDEDVLMQYGREISSLKQILEVEKLKTAEEKLEAIEKLPKTFPGDGQSLRRRNVTDVNQENDFFEMEMEDVVSNATIKATNEAMYKADIRRQLLSGSKVAGETNAKDASEVDFLNDQEHHQTELSEELLRLTTALKQNVQVAGGVIKEDNQTIGKMQDLAYQNKTDLSREGQRLEQYTKRSCMDCMMIITVMLVIWVFLLCIVVMKFFRKRI